MEDGNPGSRGMALEAAADLETAHIRQIEIQENNVRDIQRSVNRFVPIDRRADLKTRISQGLFKGAASSFVGNSDQRVWFFYNKHYGFY
jgi:hypothetical protein